MLVLDVFLSSWSFPSAVCLCAHDRNNTPISTHIMSTTCWDVCCNIIYLFCNFTWHCLFLWFLLIFWTTTSFFLICFWLWWRKLCISYLEHRNNLWSHRGKIHVLMLINTISIIDDLLFSLFPRICCHVLYSATSNTCFHVNDIPICCTSEDITISNASHYK